MLKYDNTVSSQVDGKPIYGAQVTVFTADTDTPSPATIFADEAGTTPLSQPILTDQLGYFAFYIGDGKYNIRVMTGAVEISRTNITMVDTLQLKQRALIVPVNEDGGTLPPADQRQGKLLGFDSGGNPTMAVPNSFAGPTGPANSTYLSLATLKAAAVSNASYIFAPPSGSDGGAAAGTFLYQTAGAPYTADGVNIIKLDAVPLTTGALVRQTAQAVSFLQTTGARTRDTQNKVQDMGISPRDAPGFVDADVDQMSYVQWAIDKCLASDPPAPLDLAGLFRCDLGTNKSLIINRPVDQSKARFMIAARGRRAGFRVVGNGNLIDTTLTFNGTDPCSERVASRDVLFIADSPAQAAQTMAAGKFLRISADNCEWENLKFMGSTTYAQSYDFRGCRARGWQGNFFESAGAYAINAEFECKFGGGGMFYLVGARGITQSSFMRGTYEALTGPVLTAGGASGVVVANNYIEYNGAPSIKLDAGIPNPAVAVFGNIFVQGPDQLANTNFYDIVWGVTRRARSFGNYCNGRLHDATQMVGVVPDFAPEDYADIELYKGLKAGLLDQSRATTGNVRGYDAGILYAASGQSWIGLDSMANALAFGPGIVQAGAYVPIRQLYGTVNPQTTPAFYGNPYWTQGSVVRNSGATGDGQVREWVCTQSGQPGVWRAQIMQ